MGWGQKGVGVRGGMVWGEEGLVWCGVRWGGEGDGVRRGWSEGVRWCEVKRGFLVRGWGGVG